MSCELCVCGTNGWTGTALCVCGLPCGGAGGRGGWPDAGRCSTLARWLGCRLAGAVKLDTRALAVRRLDSSAGDGGARFAVYFMLVVSCVPGQSLPAIYAGCVSKLSRHNLTMQGNLI